MITPFNLSYPNISTDAAPLSRVEERTGGKAGQQFFEGVAPSRRGVVTFAKGTGLGQHHKFSLFSRLFETLAQWFLMPLRCMTERVLTAIKYNDVHNPESGRSLRDDPGTRQGRSALIASTVALGILGVPLALVSTPLALLCKGVAHLGNRNMSYTAKGSAPQPLPAGSPLPLHSNNVGGLPDISALNGLTAPAERGRMMARAIANMPKTERPLIYCMQECFDTRMLKAMKEEFETAGNLYPFCLSEAGSEYGRLSSGLVIFSEYPITHALFRAYTGSSKFDEKLAEKGYLLARVDLGDNQALYVANTHMQGNDRHTVNALDQYLDTSVPRKVAQISGMLHDLKEFRGILEAPEEVSREIVCGDFNTEMVSGRYGLREEGVEQRIDFLKCSGGPLHPYVAVEKYCQDHGLSAQEKAQCLAEFTESTGIVAPSPEGIIGAPNPFFKLRRKVDPLFEDRIAQSFKRWGGHSGLDRFEDPSVVDGQLFGTDQKDSAIKDRPEEMVGDCEAFFEFTLGEQRHFIPFGTIVGQKKIDFILVNRMEYTDEESPQSLELPSVRVLYADPNPQDQFQQSANSLHKLTDHETLRAVLPPLRNQQS